MCRAYRLSDAIAAAGCPAGRKQNLQEALLSRQRLTATAAPMASTILGRGPSGASSWGRLEPLRETLARFSDEDKKFAFGDPHYVDIPMRRLAGH